MFPSNDWKTKKERLIEAARNDARIVGVVDYGSTSQGRGDAWSDLDIAIFIRDEDLAGFVKGWKEWVARFGDVLLAYIGGVGHPWVVYAADSLPLRVDFAFHAASTIGQIRDWPNAPMSVEAMVWYDDTNGALSATVKEIIAQSLAPQDPQSAFEQVCGDLWYYLLRTHTRMLRCQYWAARHDFNFIITGNLIALLRLEAGAVERWRGSSAAAGIETSISPARLARLDGCTPGPGEKDLRESMLAAALLAAEISETTATEHHWNWPGDLAARTITLLRSEYKT